MALRALSAASAVIRGTETASDALRDAPNTRAELKVVQKLLATLETPTAAEYPVKRIEPSAISIRIDCHDTERERRLDVIANRVAEKK
eukprot:1540301-Rhodomonas_salina.1